MTKEEKTWSPNFLKYIDYIVKNINYKGLAIKKRQDGSYAWTATEKSTVMFVF